MRSRGVGKVALRLAGAGIGRSFTAYYVQRLDLSLTQPTGDPPSAYSVLTFFLLNPDGVNDFLDTVKKINEGIKKTSSPSPVPAPGTSS